MSAPAAAPLIVPVEIDAMVLNDQATTVLRAQLKYAELANSASPDPGPFSSDEVNFAADPRNRGVYLLWTLPKGLRRQQRSPNGQVSAFPFVPNRWLVVRVFRPAGGAQPPTAASWVLRSDGIDDAHGGAAYLDPSQTAAATPTRIGLKTAVTAASPWQEPVTAPPYFLRAVAEGNPAFAAFQPFNQNVFSFFDDLQVQGVGPGTASYYVLGWYSDPSADALAGWRADDPANGFAATLGRLGWRADLSAGQTTRTSVFQGSAFGVPWQPGGPAPASPKDGVQPSIAIGSTGVDAVVAFVRAALENAGPLPSGLTPDQAAALIEAFAYDLLPMLGQPGAEAMLESQIRGNWFGSAQSGASWSVVNAAQPADTAPNEPTPDELTAEAVWLTPLNQAQAELNELTRQLLGVQRELFALCWKQGAAQVYYEQSGWSSLPWGIASTDEFPPAIAALAGQARDLQARIAGLQAGIPAATPTQTLDQGIAAFAAARGLPATRQLKQVPDAHFWSPVDPVAVISHTEHLMRLDPDGVTACRWPDALVTAIELVPGGTAGQFQVSAAQLAPTLPSVPWINLPAVGPALFAELFLLDPANVAQLAAAAGQLLTTAQLAGAAGSMSPPVPVAGHGTVASPLAPFPWSQPWRPVYFDWRIEWFPVPFHDKDGTANWAFGGLDYDLGPGRRPTPQNLLLEGRTFLTPQPSFEFLSRIRQFISDYPDSPVTASLLEIDNLVDTVDGWDFLSQSLSGLGIQLAGWNPVPTLIPDTTALPGGGTMAGLIGDQAAYPPASLMADAQRVLPASTFEGMRGGQFYVDRVTVVDAFGQTLEIVKSPVPPDSFSRTADGAVFIPLTGDGLTPTEPLAPVEQLRFVQLPPRILQPARLNFDLVGDAAPNPVIGWLLPNHPDSSVAVYGPDGTAYGALRLGVDATGSPDTAWDAAPGSPWPELPPPGTGLGDLANMAATLRSVGAGALRDFLQSVDESLWTVDPLGSRADTFLSVLIGRPLAVVRAEVSLELQSAPWRDMAWPYTFQDPSPLLLGYRFPVRLGDLGYRQDGLIGYFADGSYGAFNCVHVPQRRPDDPPLSGYLHPIAPGNYVEVGLGRDGRGPATVLTLIMDPRAGVHAQCALVPVVQATLPARWVDGALAGLAVTFRVGPALAGQRAVTPAQPGAPDTAVVLPRFAERSGVLTWVERDGDGGWTQQAVVPPDGTAALPPTAPTLREGLLRLTGAVDT